MAKAKKDDNKGQVKIAFDLKKDSSFAPFDAPTFVKTSVGEKAMEGKPASVKTVAGNKFAEGKPAFAKAMAGKPAIKNGAAFNNYGFSRFKKPLYDPKSKTPFSLSRSKVDMFLKCPRCFYLEQRLGVKIPSGPGFSLNSAVDHLLKKEFDIRRAKGEAHPLMAHYGIDAVPARHEELEVWRENFKGMRVLHKPTNFEMFGAIDDIWINPQGEYYIVDYKSTSTTKEITLDDQWKQWYKIQAEFYQWLFRARDFLVNDMAYFVFANATKDREAFDGRLEFEMSILPHKGSDAWVEPTLLKMKDCLESSEPPAAGDGCEYCAYIEKARNV